AANQLATFAKQVSDLRQLRHESGRGKFRLLRLEHHLCHAAAAFFQSSFDRALIVTSDEGADGKSGMIAIGEGNRIEPLQSIEFPHSLAWVYTQITELLGFIPRREEHKTQWLSIGAEPALKDLFLELIRDTRSPGLPHLNRKFIDCDATGQVR